LDKKIKIAVAQMLPNILDKDRNLAACLRLIKVTAKEAAQITVFPECALTGYVFTSLKEAIPMAENVPGPSTEQIAVLCRDLNIYVIVGLLEKDENKYYNAAVLMGPHGLIGKYRKLHTSYIGVDRFVDKGDLPLIVYQTDVGCIGMGICYDLRFPEHARILTILGADIIVFPTNWPEGVEFTPRHIVPTRASENHVFCVAANRVGEERGFKFFGRSQITDFRGQIIIEGRAYQEDIIYAEIDPTMAREKHQIFKAGEFESHTINDRRPEFYGTLIKP
jgi:predicted amidohydrolase